LSLDDGTTFTMCITPHIDPHTTSFKWTVPNIAERRPRPPAIAIIPLQNPGETRAPVRKVAAARSTGLRPSTSSTLTAAVINRSGHNNYKKVMFGNMKFLSRWPRPKNDLFNHYGFVILTRKGS
jgi:hypothetical protein